MTENIDVLTFEQGLEDMHAIARLDTKTSCFFDHKDPKMVKWISGRKLDI